MKQPITNTLNPALLIVIALLALGGCAAKPVKTDTQILCELATDKYKAKCPGGEWLPGAKLALIHQRDANR